MSHLVGQRRRVITISRDDTVQHAAELMCANHIGAVVVVDASGGLVGILSERDVINRVTAAGVAPQSVRVSEVMTPRPLSCADGTPMKQVQELMTRRKVRHLPVVDRDGRAAGMISNRDVLAHEVRADRARRAAAEQVAMLATCLKSLDFDEVVELVTREVPKLFDAERSVLLFTDAGTSEPLLINRCRCACADARLGEAPRAAGRAAGDDAAVAGEPPPCCRSSGASGLRVLVPLEVDAWKKAEAEAVSPAGGFLCMCGPGAESTDDRELLRYKGSLLRQILNANLTNARRYQQARCDAMTDALTGVGSRRMFENQLEQEFRRAARYSRPFCVAMLDVDDLKATNNDGGHAAGDEVLRRFAQGMVHETRDQDVLCRYGGDEFVLLMPETDLTDAMQVLERLRLRAGELAVPGGRAVHLSGGVAQYDPDDETSAKELVRCADLALYEAKRTGRNRIAAWYACREDVSADGVDRRKLADLQTRLAEMSSRSKQVLIQSVWALVHAIEARDKYTRSHSDNVVRYAVAIAGRMGVDAEQIGVIRRAAMIHDIGKIGVPDEILSKRGPLTDEQRRVIEQHPLIGVRILDQMHFLRRELPLVRHHHERWDGNGYPDGLRGDAVPRGARILAAADAFDAITSDRVYRRARSVDEALAMLADDAGRQFDPDVVEALLAWVEARREALGSDDTLLVEHLLGDGATVAA
ncbi:MAG: diguanylate cyclase [Planctomycetota bacterium]